MKEKEEQRYEDMYWIDPMTNKVVAKEIDSYYEKKIIYSQQTRQEIKKYKGLITIHSHPDSFPPSIEDLNTNYKRGYSIGIVVTHDGKVFVYGSKENIPPYYYTLKVAEYVARGYNEFEAQMKALEKCSGGFEFYVKEVTDDDE